MIPRSSLERVTLSAVFLFTLAGIFLSQTHLALYEGGLVREDGLIEWLTVLALAIGLVVNLYRANMLSPFRGRSFILWTYLMAFAFFFGLGEEISWGQRIIQFFFDFETPEFFRRYNTQGETNFHNLQFGTIKINKLIFGTCLGIGIAFYFFVLPLLYRNIAAVKARIDKLGLPIPRPYHIVAYLLLAALCQAISSGKKGEMLEFGGCWITLMVLLFPQNREVFGRTSWER